MKRVGAIVVAAALIVGALWYRGVFDGGAGNDSDPGDQSAPLRSDGSPARVICATELAPVCAAAFGGDAAVTLTFEDPGKTLDRLLGGTPPSWDLWIVSEPWPAIAEARDAVAQTPWRATAGPPFATLALRLVTTKAAAATIGCSAPDAGCALTSGRRAGMPPATTTGGLLGAVTVAQHVLGLDDFATNDLEEGTVADALRAIADSADQTADPVRLLLAANGGFDVAVGLGAQVPDAQRSRASAADVEPALLARAVVVARGSEAPDSGWAERLANTLDGSGWMRVGDRAPASGIRANPGAVDAVVKLWQQATR